MAEFAKAMLSGQAMGERDTKKVGPCDGSDPDKTFGGSVGRYSHLSRLTAEGPLSAFLVRKKTMIGPSSARRYWEVCQCSFSPESKEALERLTQRSESP